MRRIVVKVTVTNKRDVAVTKRIPKGSIVEVAQASSPFQHAMVLQDYPVTIPPKSTIPVYVEAACINRNRQWPSGVNGNLTPLRFSGLVADQSDLWEQLSPVDRP